MLRKLSVSEVEYAFNLYLQDTYTYQDIFQYLKHWNRFQKRLMEQAQQNVTATTKRKTKKKITKRK